MTSRKLYSTECSIYIITLYSMKVLVKTQLVLELEQRSNTEERRN